MENVVLSRLTERNDQPRDFEIAHTTAGVVGLPRPGWWPLPSCCTFLLGNVRIDAFQLVSLPA